MVEVFTERKFIAERLREIHKEKKELREAWLKQNDELNTELQELRNRLRELDNNERDAIDSEMVLSNLIGAVNNLTSLVPPIPVERVIEKRDEHIERLKEQFPPIEIYEKEKIEQIKEDDEKKSSIKRKKYKDLKSSKDKIINFLKEKGMPVKSKDIENYMKKEHDITWTNFTTAMNHMMNHEPRIERVTKGYYQWKM